MTMETDALYREIAIDATCHFSYIFWWEQNDTKSLCSLHVYTVIKLYNYASRSGMPSSHFSDSISWLTIGIVNFKFKDYNSALEDLSTCVKHDKKNSSAHTYLVSRCFCQNFLLSFPIWSYNKMETLCICTKVLCFTVSPTIFLQQRPF